MIPMQKIEKSEFLAQQAALHADQFVSRWTPCWALHEEIKGELRRRIRCSLFNLMFHPSRICCSDVFQQSRSSSSSSSYCFYVSPSLFLLCLSSDSIPIQSSVTKKQLIDSHLHSSAERSCTNHLRKCQSAR